MVEGITTPEDYKKFLDNEITFITFNYDRSLEHFFYNSFLTLTNLIPEIQKVELLKKIKIFHVYGTLADLPWQNDANQGLPYGNEIWVEHIVKNKNNIKTISERSSIIPERGSIGLTPIYNEIDEARQRNCLFEHLVRMQVEKLQLL